MHIRTRLVMAALTAALALSIGAGVSVALRSLSISGETRLTLTGRVTFAARSGENNGEIICNVTFVKTLARSIAKRAGARVGKVIEVRTQAPETCPTAGIVERFRAVAFLGLGGETPELWRIEYRAFLGTLPRIEGVLFNLRDIQVLLEFRASAALRCLYENRNLPEGIGVLARVTPEGLVERLTTLPEANTREVDLVIDLELFRVGCPRKAQFTASVTPSQNTTISLL